MAKTTYHIVPDGDHWAVKKEGTDRAVSTHGTQKEAIDSARDSAAVGDEYVIHRPDGTIREQHTVTDPNAVGNGNGNSNIGGTGAGVKTAAGSGLALSDVTSVGSRVNWGGVLSGVVVALAVYVTLNLLAFAIGITTIDQMASKNLAIGATIVSLFCLLVSLFLGGFIVSTTTVGEDKADAMTYGVLVWATILLLLVTSGFSMGVGFFAGTRNLATTVDQRADGTVNLDAAKDALQRQSGLEGAVSPEALAWWTFLGVILALLAAVGGALAGAGPELVFRQLQDRRDAAIVKAT